MHARTHTHTHLHIFSNDKWQYSVCFLFLSIHWNVYTTDGQISRRSHEKTGLSVLFDFLNLVLHTTIPFYWPSYGCIQIYFCWKPKHFHSLIRFTSAPPSRTRWGKIPVPPESQVMLFATQTYYFLEHFVASGNVIWRICSDYSLQHLHCVLETSQLSVHQCLKYCPDKYWEMSSRCSGIIMYRNIHHWLNLPGMICLQLVQWKYTETNCYTKIKKWVK